MVHPLVLKMSSNMKILKFGIIAFLLSFMTSCDGRHYITNDKGVVVAIQGMEKGNEVTIRILRSSIRTVGSTYITFYTHESYSINDTIYFTNYKK